MANTINVLGTSKDGLDLREFRALTKSLRGFKPDKALHKALRVGGRMIAEDAQAIIREYSESVPPTVKVRVSGTKITVVAGGDGVPLGGLLELGNKGRGKSQAAAKGGKFRHPVFGDPSVWVEQDMHPYLLPAAAKNVRGIEHLEGVAVAEAMRAVGFEVT